MEFVLDGKKERFSGEFCAAQMIECEMDLRIYLVDICKLEFIGQSSEGIDQFVSGS